MRRGATIFEFEYEVKVGGQRQANWAQLDNHLVELVWWVTIPDQERVFAAPSRMPRSSILPMKCPPDLILGIDLIMFS